MLVIVGILCITIIILTLFTLIGFMEYLNYKKTQNKNKEE
jgi:hypothetical protein